VTYVQFLENLWYSRECQLKQLMIMLTFIVFSLSVGLSRSLPSSMARDTLSLVTTIYVDRFSPLVLRFLLLLLLLLLLCCVLLILRRVSYPSPFISLFTKFGHITYIDDSNNETTAILPLFLTCQLSTNLSLSRSLFLSCACCLYLYLLTCLPISLSLYLSVSLSLSFFLSHSCRNGKQSDETSSIISHRRFT
jgi:hypothetical protein